MLQTDHHHSCQLCFSPNVPYSWYIRAVNCQLLEICRPEAIILRAASLPKAYVFEYFSRQEHLSATRVIRTFTAHVRAVLSSVRISYARCFSRKPVLVERVRFVPSSVAGEQ
jgi:hypothetical protein